MYVDIAELVQLGGLMVLVYLLGLRWRQIIAHPGLGVPCAATVLSLLVSGVAALVVAGSRSALGTGAGSALVQVANLAAKVAAMWWMVGLARWRGDTLDAGA